MVGPVPLQNLASHCSITVTCVLPGPVPKSNWLDCVCSHLSTHIKFNIDIVQTGATKGLDCTLRTQPDLSHQSKFWKKIPKAGSIWRTACSPRTSPNWRVKILEKKCPFSHQSQFRVDEGLLLRASPDWIEGASQRELTIDPRIKGGSRRPGLVLLPQPEV
jgi:hypothetical protein